MMIAAGKEMAEFVGEKNSEQSKSKWKACGEAERLPVKESERAEKFVEGEGLILRIGGSELSAGDEAGAEGEKEQDASEEQHLSGRTVRDRRIAEAVRRSGGPIHIDRKGC
jgi:hypothetical protein